MRCPTITELKKGIEEFRKHEKRDAMYRVATFIISHFWNNPADIADGLGVLLLTWNQAFYRYGIFNFDKLEQCIRTNFSEIKSFRDRNIFDFSNDDEKIIKKIFNDFLNALQIDAGKMKGRKSPVSVAKAIHLLAPKFFPLWDDKIARAYNCYYNQNPAEQYIYFCKINKKIAEGLKNKVLDKNKSILKLIDEYNYSKYTKNWI